jgi:hypothetical protein
MTQSDFLKWLDSVIGDTPLDELVSEEIMQHVDRLHLQGEDAAWQFAKEDSRESFTIAMRALSKTMFIIGYDAGREQARIDDLWGSTGGDAQDEDKRL